MLHRRTIMPAAMSALLAVIVSTIVLHHHIRIRNFLQEVRDALASRLPRSLRTYQWQEQPSVLRVYYDNPDVYYQLRVRHKARSLELGLHFEGPREEHAAWADALTAHAQAIQAQLGPDVVLEESSRKSTRLHESMPLGGNPNEPISRALTSDRAVAAAERLARFVAVLEPLLAKQRREQAG